IPTRARAADAEDWLASQTGFVEARMAEIPELVPFAMGAALPVLGRVREVIASETGKTALLPSALAVAAQDPGKIAMQVEKTVRNAVLQEVIVQVHRCWQTLGVPEAEVTIRKMRRRWGSCAVDGRTTFNWRLAFAPPRVLSYVVAHEAAHRLEMNHGPRFWAIVEDLCPGYEKESSWLRNHGEALYVYGA
ncbi:MAG: YgjP-like metallopeptidase domain-containing protein, partial [Pseudomonadota bacterium]